jgi:cobalt-precorrin 5A hydrolase
MDLDEAMIVAGIGCRKGVSEAEVLAAIEAACRENGVIAADIETLAIAEAKAGEPAIHAAARRLGRVVVIVGRESLERVEARALSRSARSREITGADSASEAAALATAGEKGRLLGPRIAVGPVTCALATDGALP